MKKTSSYELSALSPLSLQVSYVEIGQFDPENVNDPHVHPECEIYINLSGDVSFMVEKRIYSVMPGNIVISKPYEYHHCIYHSDKLHRHFWILFSLPENSSKSGICNKFLKRQPGENNLLELPKSERDELISLCYKATENKLTECEKYCTFFKILSLIESANPVGESARLYPKEIDTALDFIDKNYSEPNLSVEKIAQAAGASVNTLERNFKRFVSLPPTAYLKKKRLAAAAEQLFLGKTVSEACESCGFSDYSHFIASFKKAYGVTPLKYKKQ